MTQFVIVLFHQSELILKMVAADPSKRPSAESILKLEFVKDKSEVIMSTWSYLFFLVNAAFLRSSSAFRPHKALRYLFLVTLRNAIPYRAVYFVQFHSHINLQRFCTIT